jgi:hypothetical protein
MNRFDLYFCILTQSIFSQCIKLSCTRHFVDPSRSGVFIVTFNCRPWISRSVRLVLSSIWAVCVCTVCKLGQHLGEINWTNCPGTTAAAGRVANPKFYLSEIQTRDPTAGAIQQAICFYTIPAYLETHVNISIAFRLRLHKLR